MGDELGTILLTGANGFVGRQIFNAFRKRGIPLRLVLRPNRQEMFANLPGIESIHLTDDMFAESREWWCNVTRDTDMIVHSAWYAEPGKYLMSPLNLQCLKGTLTIAQAAATSGVRRFMGLGTCLEYDLSDGYLSIETPLDPQTPYAAAKTAAFLMLSNYFRQTDISFAWGRLFFLYGEGEDPRRLVPYIRSQLAQGKPAALTSGEQVRDYMDVRDAAEMIVNAALNNISGPLNISSGKGRTVRELAEEIAAEFGRPDLLHFGAKKDRANEPPCIVGIRRDV